MFQDTTSINDRIVQFVEYLNIDMDLFAHLCNVSSDIILNGNLADDKVSLAKILEIYPEINSKWVTSGQGSMLGSSSMSPFDEYDYGLSTNELIRRKLSKTKLTEGIRERLGIYQSYIGAYPSKLEKSLFLETLYNSYHTAIDLICRNYTNLNPKWLIYGEGDMVHNWSEFGDAIGAKYRWRSDRPLTESDKSTAEWALKSFAFRWVESCVKKGMPADEIIGLFNYAHKENDELMKSRTGGELTHEVFKNWLGISTKLVTKYISDFISK